MKRARSVRVESKNEGQSIRKKSEEEDLHCGAIRLCPVRTIPHTIIPKGIEQQEEQIASRNQLDDGDSKKMVLEVE